MFGIDVAERAVVVRADFEPVVDAAQHDVGGEDVGHRAVVELDVHHREIVDVVVVAADVALVAEVGQPRDGVRPGGNRLRADRLAVAGAALDALQVQRRRQRMAALADQHAAAAAGRVGVVDRVRAAVGLLAVDPEDLRRRSSPGSPAPSGPTGRRPSSRRRAAGPCSCASAAEHPIDAGQRRVAGRPACRPGPSGNRASRRRNSPSAASRRSTNLSRCSPATETGSWAIGGTQTWIASTSSEQGVERCRRSGCRASAAIGLAAVASERMHADDLDVGAVDLSQRLEMERGRKAGADDARANGFLFHGHGVESFSWSPCSAREHTVLMLCVSLRSVAHDSGLQSRGQGVAESALVLAAVAAAYLNMG